MEGNRTANSKVEETRLPKIDTQATLKTITKMKKKKQE